MHIRGSSGESLTFSCPVRRVKPLLKLSKGPDTFLFVGAFCTDDAAHAVLHAVDPFAAILASVGVCVGALTVLLVKSIVAFVFAAILPDIMPVAVHHAILEATLEVAAIGPLEASCAAHFVIRPVTRILRTVCPEVNAFTLLDTVFEVSMVVATVGPDLDSLTILLVLRSDLRLRLNRVKIVLNVEADVLTEHAQIRLPVLLPEAFINFFCLRLRCAEHTQATGLSIDPVAFEAAAVRPDHLPVAALRVLVVDDGVVSLLSAEATLATGGAADLTVAVDGHHAHLAHVLQRAELHGFERQLGVFEAEPFVVLKCFHGVGKSLESQLRICADFAAQLACRDALVDEILDPTQLLFVFDDQLE